jgi:thiamine pyrophosphate-dependent acetolactate synthase large subunit-like protein
LWQQFFYGNTSAESYMTLPDFVKLAEATKVGIKVEKPGDVEGA